MVFHINGDDVDVPVEIVNRLFPHQKEGLQWMLDLHGSDTYTGTCTPTSMHILLKMSGRCMSGGILGDDMGLGKTFQVCALLTSLFNHTKSTPSISSSSSFIQRVLILCPVSVLHNWMRELRDHVAPYVKRLTIDLLNSEVPKPRRLRMLSDTFLSKCPRIVVSSYQLVANMIGSFSQPGMVWDYIVLDEGHIIKNPFTQVTKAMHQFKVRHKLLLTGTPIQVVVCPFSFSLQ